MTVTKRRVKADTGVEGSAATEPGIQYTCDTCSIDITHTVRIKCAAEGCEEVDLCPNCFSEGRELGGHKAWHDYRVVETHSRPIFAEDWGADEELLLVSGLQTYGLGNWAEVADYVGTRLKEDCERHYTDTYLVERSSTKRDLHNYDDPSVNSHVPNGTADHDVQMTSPDDTEHTFADVTGEKEHSGLCTSADVINDLGGVGGFGKITKSGERGRKRRQGWWGGLGVGDGWTCPMPRMKAKFTISQEEFQARKKARIEELRKPAPLPAAAIETKASAPQNHEVAGFMPGRLEFDHEVENEAEVVIKDMDFGLIYSYGGDEMREGPPPAGGRDAIGEEAEGDDASETRSAPRPQQQSTKTVAGSTAGKTSSKGVTSKQQSIDTNGQTEKSHKDDMEIDEAEDDEDEKPLAQLVDAINHEVKRDTQVKPKSNGRDKDEEKEGEGEAEEEDKTPAVVLELEDPEDLELKLTVLEVYYSRLAKRQQIKDFIFDRGLMDYKRLAALEKKRGKEEAGLVNRYKVFAKMQTAEDFEVLIDGLIYEQTLRKRIAELQDYRRNGITTIADATRFDRLRNERASGMRSGQAPVPREPLTSSDAILQRKLYGGGEQDKAARVPYPGPPAHFLYADDVNLLTGEEQVLCCDLHVLPRPYLLIKDTLVKECARRGGELQREEASQIFDIPRDITGAIYDHLQLRGILVTQ